MSASGVRELLATAEGVIAVARTYFGVELTTQQAGRCTMRPMPARTGGEPSWHIHPNAVSAGPLVYLKNRITELPGVSLFEGTAVDDSLPLVFTTIGRSRKVVLGICNVARSRMFRTEQVVYPIDLTTMRVAGVKPRPSGGQ